MTMFRKTLIDLLLNNPMSLKQISRAVDESPGQIEDDLNHLVRSLKHTEYKIGCLFTACGRCIEIRNAFGTGLSGKNQGDKRAVINTVTDYNWTKAFSR